VPITGIETIIAPPVAQAFVIFLAILTCHAFHLPSPRPLFTTSRKTIKLFIAAAYLVVLLSSQSLSLLFAIDPL
jgi:hypothetical protein